MLTGTYDEVVGILRSEQAESKLPKFKVVELNGMRLVDPHQVGSPVSAFDRVM
ncbi:unnamed protein product [Laminaria digitata]